MPGHNSPAGGWPGRSAPGPSIRGFSRRRRAGAKPHRCLNSASTVQVLRRVAAHPHDPKLSGEPGLAAPSLALARYRAPSPTYSARMPPGPHDHGGAAMAFWTANSSRDGIFTPFRFGGPGVRSSLHKSIALAVFESSPARCVTHRCKRPGAGHASCTPLGYLGVRVGSLQEFKPWPRCGLAQRSRCTCRATGTSNAGRSRMRRCLRSWIATSPRCSQA